MSEKPTKINGLGGPGLPLKCRDGTLGSDFNRFSRVSTMTEKPNDGALLQTALRVYPDLSGHAWIRREVIMALASCSDFKLWEYVRNGELPAPVRVGKRNVAWTKDQVEEFLLRDRPKSQVGSNPVGRTRKEAKTHVS